jgi:hypothetical protein
VWVNIAKISAQLLNSLVGERGRRCPSTAQEIIFYAKARLKAFGLFSEPDTPSHFSVNQECTFLSVNYYGRHKRLGILQQILARGEQTFGGDLDRNSFHIGFQESRDGEALQPSRGVRPRVIFLIINLPLIFRRSTRLIPGTRRRMRPLDSGAGSFGTI